MGLYDGIMLKDNHLAALKTKGESITRGVELARAYSKGAIPIEVEIDGLSQLNEALALQQAEGLRLDRAIIQLGFLSERQLLELMAKELHLPLEDQ